jgi:hypothetical protein
MEANAMIPERLWQAASELPNDSNEDMKFFARITLDWRSCECMCFIIAMKKTG